MSRVISCPHCHDLIAIQHFMHHICQWTCSECDNINEIGMNCLRCGLPQHSNGINQMQFMLFHQNNWGMFDFIGSDDDMIEFESNSATSQEKLEALPLGVFKGPETLCVICQDYLHDGITFKLLPCGHIYHPNCIDQWLVSKDKCPICQKSINE